MKKKKIVFVFNAIIARCIKRVEEFLDNGYEVEVYAFRRGGESNMQSDNFSISIIGEHDTSMNYLKRALIIRKSLKQLFKKYENKDVVYYFFFFDVASIAYRMCGKPYIYEESDMPYTNIRWEFVRNFLAVIDRDIIRQSLLTTLTSEGFVEYHYGKKYPDNIIVVPNRVNPKLLNIKFEKSEIDINHIRFSYVGGFRYLTTLNFIKFAAKHFPQHTFSIYGNIMRYEEELMALAKMYSNIHVYGTFKNPDDLSSIYSVTDFVLANYNSLSVNAQYAEPNKMYEAIFFSTPIIVSSGTFLERKVKRLGIGYGIDSNNEDSVIELINKINIEDYRIKQNNCLRLPKSYSVNKNPKLFEYLDINM